MPIKGKEFAACLNVPNFNFTVGTARGQSISIGIEAEASHAGCMPVERKPFFASSGVPQLDCGIVTSRGEQAIVGTEGHGSDSALVTAQAGLLAVVEPP